MEKNIRVYFEMRLDYMEILPLLAKNHHCIVSSRHLEATYVYFVENTTHHLKMSLLSSKTTLRDLEGFMVIAGRPYVLYSIPEVYGTSDYVRSPDIDEVEICLEQSTYCSLPCDEDIYDLANLYMEEIELGLPTDAFEAATLCRCLLEQFETDLALE
ncbi:unnamed protein product [Mytilus coruscus]|uniref:Uncharacterized protein n=1 Tax=Mytilus coruscus TaxID=42192 RepID=A0A6J8D0J1_MYTCO|nr:unnamed protein product [Mytilus coruscus]